MYRSRNPTLSDSTFDKSNYRETTWWNDTSNLMTMEGTVEKTAILLLITTTLAIATYATMPELFIIGFLGGLITFLIIIFTKSTNPVAICIYAFFQGISLGGFTYFIEKAIDMQGLGILAAALTFVILAAMLTIYRAGLISWNRNLAIAVYSSIGAILFIYVVSFIGIFLGFEIPLIHGNGSVGIVFSLFVIGIGALCLVADFDFIEKGVERGAPKQLEWRAAFGLMVTLIWLYIEILNLLAKLASRR
tara:strand:- start:47101 stop:47844 length:744 start_codon:yes stop_codon:yes gene_type:complete